MPFWDVVVILRKFRSQPYIDKKVSSSQITVGGVIAQRIRTACHINRSKSGTKSDKMAQKTPQN